MSYRTQQPADQSQLLSTFEVLSFATAFVRQQDAPTPEEGKRRAALLYFLEHYWGERPEAWAQLHELFLANPGSPDNLLDVSPAVVEWLHRNHLPVTAEVFWLRRNTSAPLPEAEAYAKVFNLPFIFTNDGWRPGSETPEQAAARLKSDFLSYLEGQVKEWKRLRAALGAEAALSEIEKDSLRLLAIRQARGTKYADLAGLAKQWRKRKLGPGWEADQITEGMARQKVKAAAALVGITPRNQP